jgi:hypothetical protein
MKNAIAYFSGILLAILSPICTKSSFTRTCLVPDNALRLLRIIDTGFSQNDPSCLKKAVETQPLRSVGAEMKEG